MPSDDKALHDLLCKLFVNDPMGLYQHVSLSIGPEFAAGLPAPSVGLDPLAFAVLNRVNSHGVYAEFFRGLVAVRSAQLHAIDAVAVRFDARWQLAHDDPSPSPPPPPSPPPQPSPTLSRTQAARDRSEAVSVAARPDAAFTWLHLSDFHLQAGSIYDADLVLDALIELVRRERPHRAPDLIIASGDIAFSGRADEYANATRFFTSLLDAAGLADRRDRLVIVPGNHDVDRHAAHDLTRTLTSESESQSYFSASHPRRHFVKQLAYRTWHDTFFASVGRVCPADSTCGPLVQFTVRGLAIGVLPINTALFALGDDDHNKLWVGRRALRTPAQALRESAADLTITVAHHPVEWLADSERAQVRRTLRDSTDLLLTGHLHDADATCVVSADSEVLEIAAGAAYQGSTYPCRLFYGALAGPEIRLRPYIYADNIERWVVDASVFPDAPDHEGVFARPRRAGSFG